jgi:hypothetical protein
MGDSADGDDVMDIFFPKSKSGVGAVAVLHASLTPDPFLGHLYGN